MSEDETTAVPPELEDAPEVVSRMRHVLLLLEDPRELLKRDAFAIRVRLRTLWGSGGAFVWGVTSRGHVDRRGLPLPGSTGSPPRSV